MTYHVLLLDLGGRTLCRIIVIQVPVLRIIRRISLQGLPIGENTYLVGVVLRISSSLEFAEGKRRLERIPHCKIILLMLWCLILFDFFMEVDWNILMYIVF